MTSAVIVTLAPRFNRAEAMCNLSVGPLLRKVRFSVICRETYVIPSHMAQLPDARDVSLMDDSQRDGLLGTESVITGKVENHFLADSGASF